MLVKTSCHAAVEPEVMIATCLGIFGISNFLVSSNKPSSASLFFSCSNFNIKFPVPDGSIEDAIN